MATQVMQDILLLRQMLRRPIAQDMAQIALTVPQMQTLSVLVQSDGLTMKELSERLRLAHSTVSGIIDRLERQHLVQRTIDPADRRYIRIRVSEVVRDYVQRVFPTRRASPLEAALASASPDERALIAQGLQTLRRLVEAQDAADPAAAETEALEKLEHFL